jgi:hypothetical protein
MAMAASRNVINQFLDKFGDWACDERLLAMSNIESLAARAQRAAQIAQQPNLYKVCEGCESIIVRDAATCPNCHGYRFDPDPERVRAQAEVLGKRLPTSVPPSELH